MPNPPQNRASSFIVLPFNMFQYQSAVYLSTKVEATLLDIAFVVNEIVLPSSMEEGGWI